MTHRPGLIALAAATFAIGTLVGCSGLDDELCAGISGKTGEDWSVFAFANASDEPLKVCVGVSWCLDLAAGETRLEALPYDIPQDITFLDVYDASGRQCETVEVAGDAECGRKITVGRTCN